MPKFSRYRDRVKAALEQSEHEPTRQVSTVGDASQIRKQLEGDKVKVSDILGQSVLVKSYMEHPNSSFNHAPYCSVQIEQDGQLKYFHSGSVPLRDRLQRTVMQMPYTARFVKRRSHNGTEYLVME